MNFKLRVVYKVTGYVARRTEILLEEMGDGSKVNEMDERMQKEKKKLSWDVLEGVGV